MFKIEKSLDWERKSGALVLGIYQGSQSKLWDKLNQLLENQLTLLEKEGDIGKAFKKISNIHTLGKINFKKIIIVGLGEAEALTPRKLKEAIGAAVKALKKDLISDPVFAIDTFTSKTIDVVEAAQVASEAIGLANYEFKDYKKREKERFALKSVVFSTENNDLADCVKVGEALAEGANLARSLVNTPPNYLTPTKLSEEAAALAVRYGMTIDILEKEQMKELGMGALLGVSQGSDEPPKMIVVKYQGKETWDHILSFVGKGVTFDSGGYSLKPPLGMVDMKTDMGGVAAVLGALETIGRLKPEVNILAVIPTTENLVNGSAIKPGDVITALNGKTIEVNNTDAEGRLILADALAYSCQLGANAIVDLATLTGAIITALGTDTTGAISNNGAFYRDVQNASDRAGEWIWELPHHQPYKDMVRKSDVADLINSPGRPAGSITAGMFLNEFVGDTPWVHLDIAGTATTSTPTDLGPKGATGVMVRTLAQLALSFK